MSYALWHSLPAVLHEKAPWNAYLNYEDNKQMEQEYAAGILNMKPGENSWKFHGVNHSQPGETLEWAVFRTEFKKFMEKHITAAKGLFDIPLRYSPLAISIETYGGVCFPVIPA